jgi:hypothetical protein
MSGIRDERSQLKILNRRFLFDELLALGDIAGRLDLIEFLQYTWDLENMPSTDHRFSTASGDIWQHMVNNSDWEYDYLFGSYLNLIDGPDDQLFRFLESVVHPLVRKPGEQEEYVTITNKFLAQEGFQLQLREEISGHKVYRIIKIGAGVNERVKNLIFASSGPKPRIVLADAISNDIQITEHEQYCLIYDVPIPQTGLLWSDLIAWWAQKEGQELSLDVERSLFRRLRESLSPQSPPERLLFDTYFKVFREEYGDKLLALIPQVYLHYDPYTIREIHGKAELIRQRMDFLMLFSNHERIVIEIDGQQHYANGDKANPKKYADMVFADRQLRLFGYEVYRFGGYELQVPDATTLIVTFFRKLFEKHSIARKA